MRRRIGKAKKTGVRKVNVPNLSGLNRSQAKAALEAVGLTWSETSSVVQNVNLNETIEIIKANEFLKLQKVEILLMQASNDKNFLKVSQAKKLIIEIKQNINELYNN